MLIHKNIEFNISQLEAMDSQVPVHVVLSGGGVKGTAHIAFLEKLEQLQIPIKSISASSAGALVGAMYASGLPTADILEFFLEEPLFRYNWMDLRVPGIFNSANYQQRIKDSIKPTFEELEIPIYVTATNLEENAPYYFNSGDLQYSVLASCAVPAVFSPIKINNQYYSDGGVMDNFPIYPFLDAGAPIVGSYLGQMETKTQDELNTLVKVANHSAQLMSHSVERWKFEKTAYTAFYPLWEYSMMDTKMSKPIYDLACNFLNLHK